MLAIIFHTNIIFSVQKINFKLGDVPPCVNPLVAGNSIYNTEFQKSNQYGKLRSLKILGSQKVMLNLLNSNVFDPSKVPNTADELKGLCSMLEINSTG